ncbi:glycosyl transferase family 2 [Nanoarchaeota archaeon]
MNNILVCIVTHNPNIKTLLKSSTIIKKADLFLLVIDNNSKNKYHIKRINYIDKLLLLKKNIGLGKAYNICCKIASKLNMEWILFLDDDSLPSENFIKIIDIINELKKYKNFYKKVAIVSINFPIATKIVKINEDFYLSKYVIGSGMLVKTCICKKYKFLENLFLYNIDIEYCTRIRRAGYYILAYKDPLIKYKMGEKNKKYRKKLTKFIFTLLSKIFNKDLTSYPYYSNPNRYYIMLRNTLYLVLRKKLELSYSKYLPLFILYLYETTGLRKTIYYTIRALKYAINGNLQEDSKKIFNL